VIHSFDGILRQPRTMHTWEMWPGGPRVSLPRTMPLISIPYFIVSLLAVIFVGHVVPFVPAFGYVLSKLAGGRATLVVDVLCYVLLPGTVVWFALNSQIDGRKPHNWLISVVRSLFSPRRTWCGRAVAAADERVEYRGKVLFWWDEGAPRLQHGWVRGGRLSTAVPARFTFALRHRHRVLKADDCHDPIEDYEVPGRIEVRP
jgi:hypothetical protein